MSKSSKKRKVEEEKRVFNEKWTFNYFFVNNFNKALCLICNETVNVFKEFNLRRHYETKHKNEYDGLKSQLRQHKIDSLKQSLQNQQNIFKNSNQSELSLVKASLQISKLIAEHSKPFTDGEFIKKCILTAALEICP